MPDDTIGPMSAEQKMVVVIDPSTSQPTTRISVPPAAEKPDGVIKIRTLCLLGALLPGIGCYFCIAYTYLFQLDRVLNFTSSHCPDVKSPFPPASYSIGVWSPQKLFWFFILAIHLPPRALFFAIYNRQYRLGHSEFKKETWFRRVVYAHMRLLFLEAIGLLLVSVIDIETHFVLHAICYTIWIVSFNFNMLLNTILHHYSGFRHLHDKHDTTFQIKRFMFIVGCAVSVSTGFTYFSYMYNCSNFAYAAFSVAEYVIIGFNSAFYFLMVWELGDAHMELTIGNIHFTIVDA